MNTSSSDNNEPKTTLPAHEPACICTRRISAQRISLRIGFFILIILTAGTLIASVFFSIHNSRAFAHMFNIIGIKTDNTSAQNTPETTQGLWTSISSPSEITQPTTTGTTSLLFLGDIMLDRGVRARIKNIGADEVFVRFTKELSANYSYTIANLEGPITTWKSRTIGEDGRGIPGFSFTFPTSSAAHIKESGIDIVSLANNHTENFGTEGLQQTFDWLTRAGVTYVGTPTNSSLSTTTCAAICISYIGYNQFTQYGEDDVISEIRTLRPTSDLIIVLPHWGVEYEQLPKPSQVTLAHAWIDAGADAIIGMHPHVIQSFEWYNNAPIFYSLGNYLFDQYFSYETTHGLAVGLVYTTEQSRTTLNHINLIPIDNTSSKTRGTTPEHSQRILRTLQDISRATTPINMNNQILQGTIHVSPQGS